MQYENEIMGKESATEAPPPKKTKSETINDNNSMRGSLLLLRDIAIAIVVLIIILQFYRPTIVFEHSMEDTLHPEDYVFLSKQAYTFGEVEFGDIIVFESQLLNDRGGKKSLIKRVIGLPGDTIEVKDEAVYRNGERLIEPYVKDSDTPGQMAAVKVPSNSYFVLGDNRAVSMDSRSSAVGFIAMVDISGKVVFRLFPISNAGIIR